MTTVADSFSTMSFAATPDGVAAAREAVAEFLQQHGLTAARVGDVRLAMSEIGSNVVEHSDEPSIDVSASALDDRFVIDVAGAPDPGRLGTGLPGPDMWTGRGLGIVSAIVDRAEVLTVDHARVLRCTLMR